MRIVPFAYLLFWVSWVIAGEKLASVCPSGKADGKQFNFTVTDADVRKTPIWSPHTPNPPLDPRRAGEIARQQLDGFVADPTKWRLHEISLVDFGDHHWAYVVRFDRHYPPDFGGVRRRLL
jgi:hypothetical protein